MPRVTTKRAAARSHKQPACEGGGGNASAVVRLHNAIGALAAEARWRGDEPRLAALTDALRLVAKERDA